MRSMLPGGAHSMGSGSFDGASSALAANAPEASRGEAAQYCKNRRRLVARMFDDVIGSTPLPLFFLCAHDSSRSCGSEGFGQSSPDMHSGFPMGREIQKVMSGGGLRKYFGGSNSLERRYRDRDTHN